MAKNIAKIPPDAIPLEKDLLGQNGAITPRSRIIGGSIQDLPEESEANQGEIFHYVNPMTESQEAGTDRIPAGERHSISNGAGDQYGGPVKDRRTVSNTDKRLDYTGTNGEIRREINRDLEVGDPVDPDFTKGVPPPVK